MGFPTEKTATAGILTGLALIFGYIESVIPFFAAVPGIKLGLANLIVLFALYRLNWKWAACINLVRILLSALLFGNGFSFIYSAFGAVVAFLVMLLLKNVKVFSPCGVSIGGAAAHNVGQIIACIVFTQTKAILYYVPVLIFSGAIFGLITGIIASLVLDRLKSIGNMHF